MRATLEAERLVLVPDEPTTLAVEVTNSLEVVDGVTASLKLGEGLRVTSDPQILLLFPDGSGVLTLTLTATRTLTAGVHEADVVVRSSVDPVALELPLELEVTPAPAAVLSAEPAARTGRTQASFTLLCENRGNTPVQLSLAASDPVRAIVPDFDPPLLSIEPGGTAHTELSVATRRQWLGGNVRRVISIVGTSNDLDLEAKVTFNQQPVIPRGVRTALVLGAVVALWAVVFVFALNRALASDPLTKEVPASFYGVSHSTTGSTVHKSASAADLIGLTSADTTTTKPPAGAVPKSGVVIGVGGTIEGTVHALSTGSGIGRITVQATRYVPPTGDTPGRNVLVASAATGSDGKYSIAGLLPGDYELRFSAAGYADVWWPQIPWPVAPSAGSSLPPPPPGARPVPVAAQLDTPGVNATITGNNGTITGSVDTGQMPPPGVFVVATLEAEGAGTKPFSKMVGTNASGAYTISGVPAPGTYDLSFVSTGYLDGYDVEEVTAGATQVANTITLKADNGTLGGVVTDGTKPLGGVTITASSNGQSFVSATPTTGPVGSFSMTNLPTPSTYLLTLSKPGYGTQTLAVNLGPGGSVTNLAIALQGGAGQISGAVTDASGSPLGGVTVTVNGASGTASTQTLTGGVTAGTYLVSGLATPGNYTVTFSFANYVSETVAANLPSSGSVGGLNVTLPLNVGTITGTVVAAGGAPLSGVQVSINDGVAVRTTQTSSTPPGGFAVTGLAPDSYSVTFSLAGYQSQTALVRLAPGASQTVPITLVKQPGGSAQ